MLHKFKTLPLASIILFCLTPSLMANDPNAFVPNTNGLQGYYLGIDGGVAYPRKFSYLLRKDYVAGGQVGYRYDNYRVEIAVNGNSNRFRFPSQANYNLFTAMLNTYYDLNFDGLFVPFVGVGVGYLNAQVNGCVVSFPLNNCTILRTGGRLAYQGIVGIGLSSRHHIRFDIRYRYLTFTANSGYYQNIFEGALNYFF